MSVVSTNTLVSIINKRNKMIGFYHNNKPYVIGFKNAHIARNIMYNLHDTPTFTLLYSSPRLYQDVHTSIELNIDSEATLFIPKNVQLNNQTENEYYITSIDYEDFIVYPYTKNIGVILPYVLLDETKQEFTYRSHVIEPFDLSSFLI